MAPRRISVGPNRLGEAVSGILSGYASGLTEKVDRASESAARDLVKRTRATAPRGSRKRYYRRIACKKTADTPGGETWTWHVTGREYRLSHLLEHGHAKVGPRGGRTRAFGFIRAAWEPVEREYEQAVRRAVADAS